MSDDESTGGSPGEEPPGNPGDKASAAPTAAAGGETSRSEWLWDHTGRLAGAALGLLAFAAMVFLAAIGFKPALFLVVLLVAGVLIIAVGGRIRGSLR